MRGIKNKDSFWIVNGKNSSYSKRKEIRMWGGYYNEERKVWRIDLIDEESFIYRAIKRLGLKLQKASS